ncbi:glycolate oxidase subunit GlcE [Tateyamaria omphalii]|uniref:Glycolate oxidase subunit GlcE n=1 Tax=Tateyamaria omphalii TaxID=299262 RepID=A0A1P8MY88_9RHOB|nr:glycolate oxidase subunit GlcE [Tateyamaria omphalii]APX12879.1 glycolate oxidase subunit GlcE [Tateyamaria omphalii]
MDMLGTEEAVAQAVAEAKGPLVVRGGGTRTVGRPVVGEVLDVSGLSGVTLYEPGALTLVAQAGTPVAEIEATLAAENQRLAFEPYDLAGLLGTSGASTIGGVIATNASGPRRIMAGAARDFALGVRFVDGVGKVVKNGGRVMKNVTGYDLVKLMSGSWGTLGVLTEVSLKVLPSVEAEVTLVIEGLDAEQAVKAMSRALGSPFEVSGAAWVQGQVWLRIEGFEGSVAYRAGQLKQLLAGFGDSAEVDADWTTVRDAVPLHGAEAVWRISVKPSDGPAVIAALPEDAHALMDWGGGLVWAGMSGGDVAATHAQVQAMVAGMGGHATLIKGPEAVRAAVPVFQPEAPGVAALTASLRQRFDPNGILNPGLMAA